MAAKKPTRKKKATSTRKKGTVAKLRVTQPRKAKAYPPMPKDTNQYFTEAQDGSAYVSVPVAEWAKMIQQNSLANPSVQNVAQNVAGVSTEITDKTGNPSDSPLGALAAM